MPAKFKRFVIPFFLTIAFVIYFSNSEFLLPQPETTKTLVKPDLQEFKKQEGIIHSNCLYKCPSGAAIDNILVNHDIIILSSNKKTKFADWVSYKVIPDNINGPERKRNWAKDPKIDIEFTFTPQDYKGMSKEPYFFDRGHQAPLASLRNHPKWYVLNYLSNITPQKKDLNRGPWKKLESAERNLVKQFGKAYVLTGPYYEKNNILQGPLIERFNYTIPSGYWKIISIKKDGKIKTASFMFSQNVSLKGNYCKYIVSVPDIEKSTGLKFFDGKVLHTESTLSKEIGCNKSDRRVTIH